MKLRFVLVAALLLAWCSVDARPQPGTTGKHNEDLDGIGADLEDFLKHRDQNNNHKYKETQDIYSHNRDPIYSRPRGKGAAAALQPPALAAAVLGALCVWLLAETRS